MTTTIQESDSVRLTAATVLGDDDLIVLVREVKQGDRWSAPEQIGAAVGFPLHVAADFWKR